MSDIVERLDGMRVRIEGLEEILKPTEIESLRQQLAESQALVKAKNDALERLGSMEAFSMPRAIDQKRDSELLDRIDYARGALAMPFNSTALDSAIRQAKREGGREALLEAAEVSIGQQPEFQMYESNPVIWKMYLRRMSGIG